jgi:23S rRNA A2030 N6-methylase RlmJ
VHLLKKRNSRGALICVLYYNVLQTKVKEELLGKIQALTKENQVCVTSASKVKKGINLISLLMNTGMFFINAPLQVVQKIKSGISRSINRDMT